MTRSFIRPLPHRALAHRAWARSTPVRAALGVASLALAGCVVAPPQTGMAGYSSGMATGYQVAPQAAVTQAAIVIAVEVLPAAGMPPNVGLVAGAVLGGVIGSRFGQGRGATVGTVAGAAAGALAGSAIESHSNQANAIQRITLEWPGGARAVIVQPANPALGVGRRAWVSGEGANARVIPY